jgi:S-DNA-T family DNA segregation ATPase FtsK/SpoIIIE
MSGSFSVTEVRNALRCPRIFALGRMQQSAVAFPVGSSCLGSSFHRLVDRFAKTVDAPADYVRAVGAGAPADEVSAVLVRALLSLLEDELESDPTFASMPAEVDDLAEALRELARHLSARIRRFEGKTLAEALHLLIRDGERQLQAEIGEGIVVTGAHDALYSGPDGAMEVIEYKLTDEANDALDRAQVALYRHMLAVSRGISARPTVLRFMPVLRETALSEAEADDIITRTVKPMLRDMVTWSLEPGAAPATARRDLCAACPMAGPCADAYPERVAPRDDPPAGAARPRIDIEGTMTAPRSSSVKDAAPTDEEGRAEAARLRDWILAELRKQGVAAVCPRPPTVGPTIFEIEVTRPRGPVKALDQMADDIKHRLATAEDGTEAEYERRGGKRLFIVRRPVPRKVYLTALLAAQRAWLSESSGRFIVGQRPSGEVLCGDFADSSTPHLLIGGQAGSGKSFLLRALVASLVHFHPPSQIRFSLIDPKRVTFNVASFQAAVGAHLDGPIGYDAEEALPVIERLVEIMQERYELFEQEKVSDLREYNEVKSEKDRLERKVVVVDEFQDLTADKATAKPFFEGVKRLGAKARAAGVHLILATQRPDRETVPPIVKANLGGKIALRVASQMNSRIILDEGGAERLLGKGDLLADLGHGAIRAQAPLVS